MSKAISSLAVGDKIEVPVLSAYQSRFGAKIIFKVADKNHSGYPSNSVTLITEKIIQLMCSDAKEAKTATAIAETTATTGIFIQISCNG